MFGTDSRRNSWTDSDAMRTQAFRLIQQPRAKPQAYASKTQCFRVWLMIFFISNLSSRYLLMKINNSLYQISNFDYMIIHSAVKLNKVVIKYGITWNIWTTFKQITHKSSKRTYTYVTKYHNILHTCIICSYNKTRDWWRL